MAQVPPEIRIENDAITANNNGYKNGGGHRNKKGKDSSSSAPKEKSIAHNHLKTREAMFLSFDVETGKNLCGIIPFSYQNFNITPPATTSDTPKIMTTDEDLFNKYVTLLEDGIWSQHAINVDGISSSDPQIQVADTI